MGTTRSAAECPGATATRDPKSGAWKRPDRRRLTPRDEERIREARVPPSYTDAVVCLDGSRVAGYATDSTGKKQIFYTDKAVENRRKRKAEDTLQLATALPRLLPSWWKRAEAGEQEPLIALLVLETAARPGHEDHLRARGTVGISTLSCKHAGTGGQLAFPSKHGVVYEAEIRDERLRRIFRRHRDAACARGRAAQLFQVPADAFNEWLSEELGRPFTAKSLRTLVANVQYLAHRAQNPEGTERDAVEATAALLNNTPSVCSKEYIHEETKRVDARRIREPKQLMPALRRALAA